MKYLRGYQGHYKPTSYSDLGLFTFYRQQYQSQHSNKQPHMIQQKYQVKEISFQDRLKKKNIYFRTLEPEKSQTKLENKCREKEKVILKNRKKQIFINKKQFKILCKNRAHYSSPRVILDLSQTSTQQDHKYSQHQQNNQPKIKKSLLPKIKSKIFKQIQQSYKLKNNNLSPTTDKKQLKYFFSQQLKSIKNYNNTLIIKQRILSIDQPEKINHKLGFSVNPSQLSNQSKYHKQINISEILKRYTKNI